MFSLIFSIALSLGVYYLTQNYMYSMLSIVIGLMMGRALAPYGTLLWLKIRPPKTHVVKALDDDEESRGKGMRLLVITQNMMIDEKIPEQKGILDKLIADAMSINESTHDNFRPRYDIVGEKKLPVQICVGKCGKLRTSVGSAFNEWKTVAAVDSFKDAVDGTDLFITDCNFTHPENGENTPAMVVFLFDPRLSTQISTE